MSGDIRYNFGYIRGLLKDPETARAVRDVARRVEQSARRQRSGARVDSATGNRRFRAAVIAGYEPGATADRTRDVLLRALDAGDG